MSLLLAESSALLSFIAPVVLWILLFGLSGSWIGDQRDRGPAGFVLGVLFGPLGLLLAALIAPSPKWAYEDERRRELARCRARSDYRQRRAEGQTETPPKELQESASTTVWKG